MPVWWNGRHARLKSGCPVGRASSSPATGTRGRQKRLNMGARVRVLWPTLGRVALWLVPPVGRWCPAFGGWCAGSCCALRVLDGCFVSLFLDSNPAWLLGPTANRFARIVRVRFDSSAVRWGPCSCLLGLPPPLLWRAGRGLLSFPCLGHVRAALRVARVGALPCWGVFVVVPVHLWLGRD